MKVYFDNAATTPPANEVIAEVALVMKNQFGNPSSIHQQGREARALVEMSRKKIAAFIGAQSSEIVFTSGGTEANNLAISAAVKDLNVQHIISSTIEHPSVFKTIQKTKVQIHWLTFNQKGEINLSHLRELLSSLKTNVLVSLMHVNNEVGTVLPLKEVAELCTEYGAFFHSDTVQSIGHFPIDVKNYKIDFLTCSAHKLHGLKGSGFLYINKKHKISAQIIGGAQERDIRAGTENVTGIVSLAKALSLCNIDIDFDYVKSLKDRFLTGLKLVFENKFTLNGSHQNSSPYILNVSLPKQNNSSMLLFNLDIEGIAVSGGSACSSGSIKGSRILAELGVDQNLPAIRFSFSKYNTTEEVDFVLEKLKKLYS